MEEKMTSLYWLLQNRFTDITDYGYSGPEDFAITEFYEFYCIHVLKYPIFLKQFFFVKSIYIFNKAKYIWMHSIVALHLVPFKKNGLLCDFLFEYKGG